MLIKSKFFRFLIGIVFLFDVISCTDAGVTTERLSGNESSLPPELKGLKVYSVQLIGGNYCRVAILNGNVNSSTYMVGKIQETTIIVNGNQPRTILAKQILSETDSIIVIKK